MTGCALLLKDSPTIVGALSQIDCSTAQATRFAFGRLLGPSGALLPALTAFLTVYVALTALALLTGRARLNVGTMTPRMLGLGLVLTFSTSWIAYEGVVWNLLTGAPDQVATLLTGEHGSATYAFAHRLDQLFANIADLASQTSNQALDSSRTEPTAGNISVADILWVSALMLMLGTIGILVAARVALAALLALGPVFIVFALFRGTRGLSEGWLKAAVLFACVPLFTVLLGGAAIGMIMPFVPSDGVASLQMAATLLLGAAVYCALMFMVLKISTTLVLGWQPLRSGSAPVLPASRAAALPALRGSSRIVAPYPARDGQSSRGSAHDRVQQIVGGLAGIRGQDRINAMAPRSPQQFLPMKTDMPSGTAHRMRSIISRRSASPRPRPEHRT
jgi:type IV secretion system protein VirB6